MQLSLPSTAATALTSGAPEYRGRPLARREHILEKRTVIEVLTDDGNRLVIRWGILARSTDSWVRRAGSDWFELEPTI